MMAPRLRWALAATLVATAAVALMADEEEATSVPAAPERSERVFTAEPAWPAGPRESGPVHSAPGWPEAGPVSQRAWGAEPAVAAAAARVASASTARIPAGPAPSPTPPPPSPPAAVPAAAATAPPPYTWIGRIDDGGEPRALLLGAQNTLLVRRGDTLDGRWQVQSVHAQGVTLLPLGAGQALTLSFKPT